MSKVTTDETPENVSESESRVYFDTSAPVPAYLNKESPNFRMTQMRIQQMRESNPEAYAKMINME